MKIDINEELVKQLQGFFKDSSFKDLDELVDFILKDYLEKNKMEEDADSDKDILQERLKNLGYL